MGLLSFQLSQAHKVSMRLDLFVLSGIIDVLSHCKRTGWMLQSIVLNYGPQGDRGQEIKGFHWDTANLSLIV